MHTGCQPVVVLILTTTEQPIDCACSIVTNTAFSSFVFPCTPHCVCVHVTCAIVLELHAGGGVSPKMIWSPHRVVPLADSCARANMFECPFSNVALNRVDGVVRIPLRASDCSVDVVFGRMSTMNCVGSFAVSSRVSVLYWMIAFFVSMKAVPSCAVYLTTPSASVWACAVVCVDAAKAAMSNVFWCIVCL